MALLSLFLVVININLYNTSENMETLNDPYPILAAYRCLGYRWFLN